jgi:hypothetical protein
MTWAQTLVLAMVLLVVGVVFGDAQDNTLDIYTVAASSPDVAWVVGKGKVWTCGKSGVQIYCEVGTLP